MNTSAWPVIASRILARQSSPGHRYSVSRHTVIPAASSLCWSTSTSAESSRTYEMKTWPR